MRHTKAARLGLVAVALVGAWVVGACEAPLPVAPLVAPSPEASASVDPLGPPSF